MPHEQPKHLKLDKKKPGFNALREAKKSIEHRSLPAMLSKVNSGRPLTVMEKDLFARIDPSELGPRGLNAYKRIKAILEF